MMPVSRWWCFALVVLTACGPPAEITQDDSTGFVGEPPAMCGAAPCDVGESPNGGCERDCEVSSAEVSFSQWRPDWTPTALALDRGGTAWISGFGGSGSRLVSVDHDGYIVEEADLIGVTFGRLAFAPNGDIVVAGREGNHTYLERRTRDGTVLWSRITDDDFDINDLSVTDDRILLTGASWPHPAAEYDVHVAVFDRDGEPVWSAGYNGPFDGAQIGREIMADAAGDVYVVGVDRAARAFDDTDEGQRDTDVWMRKYDATGEMLWTQRYDGLASDVDEAVGAALAPEGDMLVVGYETTSDGYRTIELVVRLAPNGAPWWIKRREVAEGVSSVARCAAFTGSGYAAIAGTQTEEGSRQYFVSRLDPSGEVVGEVQRSAFGAGSEPGPFDIAIAEDSGDVVVLGADRDDDEDVAWLWRTTGTTCCS